MSYCAPSPSWKNILDANQIIFLHQVEKLKLANTEVTAEQVSFLCDELKGLNQNQVSRTRMNYS